MKKPIIFVIIILLAMLVPTVVFAINSFDYSLTYTADSNVIDVGKTAKVSYKLMFYDDSEYTIQSIKYSTSDSSIAEVDQDGTVTGISPGTVDISVELTFDIYIYRNGCTFGFNDMRFGEKALSGNPATEKRKVTIQVVSEKELSMNDITLLQSESGTMTVTFGEDYSGSKDGTWSVADTSVVSIDQKGRVTGLNAGKTTVGFTLTETQKTVTGSVTVEKLLNLDPASLSIYAGTSETVTASYHTRFAGDKSGTWSAADASVATVDQNGTVTGIKAGTTTLTYTNTETGVRAECPVTVKALFTLKPDPAYVMKGTSGYIKVSFDESYTGDKSGTWTIADGSIAAVSQSGTVTGKNDGTTVATFTHTATGIKEKCSVIVGSLVFTISPDPLRIENGTAGSLAVSFDNSYTGDKSGTWSIADASIAAVRQDGTVTGIKAGTTSVSFTHTATGTEDECTIIVLPTFAIAPNPLEIEKGATSGLHVNFEDGYTGDKSGVWSISDASIATVDQSGTVTGLKAGATTAVFTAAASDIAKTAAIIVTEPAYYTVTFDTNGGSQNPAPAKVLKNQTIVKPSDPFRGGYTFIGWYTAKDGNDKWDFAAGKVTSDMTLYAHWQEAIIYPETPFTPVTSAPTISGPGTISLLGGYSSYSQAYTFSGSPSPAYGIDTSKPNTALATFSGTALTIPSGLSAGSYTVTLYATNAVATVTKTISVTVSAVSISLTPATLPSGLAGRNYSGTLTASGGISPYTYSVTSGALPSGLSLDSNTGAISGTPDTRGIYSFTVTAADSGGNTGAGSYTVAIFSIDQDTFTVALNSTSAAGLLSVSDGSGDPCTYSLVSSSSLFSVDSGGTIMIVGTLDTVATYILTVEVTDSAGNSIVIEITISVEDI
jgi:uncharacterized repeat protein (TIGR02543 family)